jgi:molecular chaperone GrpE (heat shock protein)
MLQETRGKPDLIREMARVQVFMKALSDANITKFHPLDEKFDPEFASGC